MIGGRATITLDLLFEVDDEEFRNETGMEEDRPISRDFLREQIQDQIEEAVKASGNGSSISFSFGELETDTSIRIDDI